METSNRERRNFLKCFGLATLCATFFSGKKLAAAVATSVSIDNKGMPKVLAPQGLVAHKPIAKS